MNNFKFFKENSEFNIEEINLISINRIREYRHVDGYYYVGDQFNVDCDGWVTIDELLLLLGGSD